MFETFNFKCEKYFLVTASHVLFLGNGIAKFGYRKRSTSIEIYLCGVQFVSYTVYKRYVDVCIQN
jgi:hypothetical protein